MSHLLTGALVAAADPSPNPTEGNLRPGLETWQVSPGLVGFLATFALAVAVVLLILSMTKHLRQAQHNARQQGLPVPEPEVISFRRSGSGSDGGVQTGGTDTGAGGGRRSDGGAEPDVAPSTGSGSSGDGGSGGSDSGGGGGD